MECKSPDTNVSGFHTSGPWHVLPWRRSSPQSMGYRLQPTLRSWKCSIGIWRHHLRRNNPLRSGPCLHVRDRWGSHCDRTSWAHQTERSQFCCTIGSRKCLFFVAGAVAVFPWFKIGFVRPDSGPVRFANTTTCTSWGFKEYRFLVRRAARIRVAVRIVAPLTLGVEIHTLSVYGTASSLVSLNLVAILTVRANLNSSAGALVDAFTVVVLVPSTCRSRITCGTVKWTGAGSLGELLHTVRRLLDGGADVNALGRRYWNALQVASSKGDDQTVRLLVEKGADINFCQTSGHMTFRSIISLALVQILAWSSVMFASASVPPKLLELCYFVYI